MSNIPPSHPTTVNWIRETLCHQLNPTYIEVDDDSWQHVGHPGAQQGGGHFTLWIQAESLSNLSAIKAHQVIYQTLQAKMGQEIHALSIQLQVKPVK